MNLIISDRPVDVKNMLNRTITYVDLSSLKIASCMGCFNCWIKTPGKCVIRDDATHVYPCIARSDEIMYISRIRYGGYDTVMKTMLERAIPIQQAFIRVVNGETHHVQRNVVMKKATIIAYNDIDITEDEKTLFRRLVSRNANNMSFASYEIIFTTESMLNGVVKDVLKKWEI